LSHFTRYIGASMGMGIGK